MSRADAIRFRDAIVRRLGLHFEDAKLEMLSALLRSRARATGRSPESYAAWFASDAPHDELTSLAEELTVGETYFFRHIEQFEALARVVVPERIRAVPARRQLQVLSAGCASGEEAYSLAIIVGNALPDPSWRVSVRAIDINPVFLRRAALARYTPWSLRQTPEELHRRWFRHDGRDIVLDERVRDAVRFEQRNLADEDPHWAPERTYDVIFCRNVLMYFAPDVARAVVARLERALAPGGYLFLGHAETLRGLSQQFDLCHTDDTFYYRQRGGAQGAPAGNAFPPSLATVIESSTSWVDAIQHAAERIRALTDGAPAGLPARPRDLERSRELLQQERFAEALASLPADAERDPDALLLRAVLLTHGGRLDEAEQTCLRLIALDELNAGAHYVLALCREGAKDLQAAADHDQVALYLDPSFAMPRLHLGLLARRAGDRQGARRELVQALILLQREDASRLLLFGGGFHREALVALCRAELDRAGDA